MHIVQFAKILRALYLGGSQSSGLTCILIFVLSQLKQSQGCFQVSLGPKIEWLFHTRLVRHLILAYNDIGSRYFLSVK
jgi:hypothetical protein